MAWLAREIRLVYHTKAARFTVFAPGVFILINCPSNELSKLFGLLMTETMRILETRVY